MSRVKIITDPAKWPPEKYKHIFEEQPFPVPETAVKAALHLWGVRRPHAAHNYEAWWKDLTEFDPALKGYKLAGHGEQPDTILFGERPQGRKLTDAPKPPDQPKPTVPPEKPSAAESGAKILGDLMIDPDAN